MDRKNQPFRPPIIQKTGNEVDTTCNVTIGINRLTF